MSRPKDNFDAEVAALQTIVGVLNPLDQEARIRVLASVVCLYDTELARRVVRWWQERAA